VVVAGVVDVPEVPAVPDVLPVDELAVVPCGSSVSV
jgi:hypothetical protein